MLFLIGSSPEPAFQLTSSDFRTVLEDLASDEQKLTRLEQLLDLRKDLATGSDLPLLQCAEKAVYHYQHLLESSVERPVSA